MITNLLDVTQVSDAADEAAAAVAVQPPREKAQQLNLISTILRSKSTANITPWTRQLGRVLLLHGLPKSANRILTMARIIPDQRTIHADMARERTAEEQTWRQGQQWTVIYDNFNHFIVRMQRGECRNWMQTGFVATIMISDRSYTFTTLDLHMLPVRFYSF